ncbi:diphthine--ammonia ligase [Acinetobacter sp. ANC 4635]|uniref:Dph6-related ATP pyrophosphatase n=1 Tax=Acinetobacter sp. ANC 4635 TaxID=2529846 RepID=UPI00103A7A90|nr:diphthine--ammonia ligase [Acinetobacter sp. ANC 4635]TCB32583.1 diphthine--ammonia ligase [Acinetobacter sp. ANC 4635]
MQMLWNANAQNKKFVASYSGGKDSSLALFKAMQMGEAIGLIVMLEENGQKSRSHGMSLEIIHAQADAIGLPIFTASATWQNYEVQFIQLLEQQNMLGAEVLVTGDIDLLGHAEWNQSVCDKSQLKLCMPLWQKNRLEIINEFINLGFQSVIVTVNLDLGMKVEDLGRVLTTQYVEELCARGIDPCGEAGEFHTTVIDGPIFKKPLSIRKGDILYHNNYAFLPLTLEHHEI